LFNPYCQLVRKKLHQGGPRPTSTNVDNTLKLHLRNTHLIWFRKWYDDIELCLFSVAFEF